MSQANQLLDGESLSENETNTEPRDEVRLWPDGIFKQLHLAVSEASNMSVT